MKKILALILVVMLVLISVFTGVIVSAEDEVAEETTTTEVTHTVWEEEFGIEVDETIFPGYYVGNDRHIMDEPDQTKWTTENGVKYYRVDPKGTVYTFRDPILHRRYAPSIAVNAGRTGGEGDNALIFGLPMAYKNGYLLFRNRDQAGNIACGSGTFEVSFDVKLVYGKVDNIYSNFIKYAPGISDNANCVTEQATSTNVSGNTEGYTGADISTGRWTTLKYTVVIDGSTNSFFINFTAPEEGAVVLIDNIKILNSKGVNVFNGDEFTPITNTGEGETSLSPYYQDFVNGNLYINNEFGNFNSADYVQYTSWSDYGLYVDETIVPGYYLASAPYCFSEDADETERPGNDGTPYLYTSGGWYGNVATRRQWAPVVAIGAGKTGRADDNALVCGMPKATAQTPIAFYIRNQESIVYTANTKYQISFDIKSVAGTCKGIYSTIIIDKPGTASPTKFTCENSWTKDDVTYEQYAYNNKYDSVTGTYGTDGYSQDDISTEYWTTLTFDVTPASDCNWFYINIVPEDDAGAVVLIDNITIVNEKGENLFVDENVRFTNMNSPYYGKYPAIQHYLGTFDYADSKPVKNVIDKNTTFIPVEKIGYHTATVEPTLSEVGEGVNGSYAINVGVNNNCVNNLLFMAYNPKAEDTIHPNGVFMFEFKARLKAGQISKLDVGIATNSYKSATPYHNMQILQSGTTLDDNGEIATYNYKSYTRNYLQVAGEDITSEWQTFRFYTTTNCYENSYRHLKFVLNGVDSTAVLQLDDIKGYSVANGELTPINVWAAADPEGSSFDLAQISAYDVSTNDDGEVYVRVPNASVTVSEFIENLKINSNFKYGYENVKEMHTADGTVVAEDQIICTDYALKLIGTRNANVQYPKGSIYKTFNVAVANDITSDGVVDARDVVRAKRVSVGAAEATYAQLVAANAADENGIQAEDVVAIRGIFMN